MDSCLEGCLGVALLTREAITHGPAVSVIGPDSVIIWVRGGAVGWVMVKYWHTADPSPINALCKLDEEADFTGRATLTGLRPSTQYNFSVETGAPVGIRHGAFRTPAAADERGAGVGALSFVFGSCVGGQGYGRFVGDGDASGFPAFKAMMALEPDFFVCNGDFIYADNAIEPVATTFWNKGDEHVIGEGMAVASDLAGFRARYRYHLADPKLASFLACTPMLSTWDDHEIVDDWGAERMRNNGQAQLLEDGMRAWFEYQPYLPPRDEPRRVYRTARWGPHVEFFVLDCRSYRAVHAAPERPEDIAPESFLRASNTPQMKTILGDEQLRWLLDGLSASTATWKMICTSVSTIAIEPQRG